MFCLVPQVKNLPYPYIHFVVLLFTLVFFFFTQFIQLKIAISVTVYSGPRHSFCRSQGQTPTGCWEEDQSSNKKKSWIASSSQGYTREDDHTAALVISKEGILRGMKQSECLSELLPCYVMELACFSIAKVFLLAGFLPSRIFLSILPCKLPWKPLLLQTVPEYLSIFPVYVKNLYILTCKKSN